MQRVDIPAETTTETPIAVDLSRLLAAQNTQMALQEYDGVEERLTRSGKAAEAETQIREAISSLQDVYKAGHPVQAAARSALGECLLAQGKLAEAEGLLVSSVEQLRGRQRVIRLYESKGITESVRLYREELAAFERKARLNEATDG